MANAVFFLVGLILTIGGFFLIPAIQAINFAFGNPNFILGITPLLPVALGIYMMYRGLTSSQDESLSPF